MSDIRGALATTMQAMDGLSELLDAETRAIRAMDQIRIHAMQEAKQKASRDYESRLRQLHARRAEIEGVEEEMRARFREARGRLTRKLDENLRAFQATHAASKRLVDIVVRTVRDQVEPAPTGYARAAAAYAPRPVAFTINQML